MKDANAAMTLLEKWPEKIQALNGIQTYNLCVINAMQYQLSYKSTWEQSCLGSAL